MSVSPPIVAGRVPPHDLDCEASVLSTLMLTPERLDEVSAWLRAEHFYSDSNGLIYEAIVKLGEEQRKIDIVTVASYLRSSERLAQVGGAQYIGQLADATPAVANVAEHAATVYAKHKQRTIIAASQRVAADGYGDVGNVDAWASEVATTYATIADDGAGEDHLATGAELTQRLYDRWQNPTADVPLRMGIPDLDRVARGMRAGQLIVVGAHSGIGKSALALNFATHTLLNERLEDKDSGVLIFSLEMSSDELMERMGCSLARIDSRKLDPEYRGEFTADDGRALVAALNKLSTDRLVIDDRCDVTPAQIRSTARSVAARMRHAGSALRLVVIDYAQLVSPDGRKRETNREQEVAAVGRAAKKLAKELKVPVILLAQLNSDGLKEGRKPRGSDLRESKGLLQDADKCILVHNPAAEERKAAVANGERARLDPNASDTVDIIVDKHRGGRTGTVRASYWPALTTFGSYAGNDADIAETPATKPSARRAYAKAS